MTPPPRHPCQGPLSKCHPLAAARNDWRCLSHRHAVALRNKSNWRMPGSAVHVAPCAWISRSALRAWRRSASRRRGRRPCPLARPAAAARSTSLAGARTRSTLERSWQRPPGTRLQAGEGPRPTVMLHHPTAVLVPTRRGRDENENACRNHRLRLHLRQDDVRMTPSIGFRFENRAPFQRRSGRAKAFRGIQITHCFN
jgi:hypothetical protein